jgi:hypothetical protein
VAFTDWLVTQTWRSDVVGRIARDLVGERRRTGRPLTALNHRPDFLFYVSAMPKELEVTRRDALSTWAEWLDTESRQL